VAITTGDERRHPPGEEPLWGESWYFDFASHDGGLGGWVRLGLYPNLGVSWYTAFLAGPGRPLVAVVDLEAPLPGRGLLELRSEGLWADHICEAPFDHWTVVNEAFGIAVDDPAELYGRGLGDRVPLGFDLEWEDDAEPYDYEVTTRYEIPCRVHGEILVGSERIELEGLGQRDHSWGVRDWWQFGWCWAAGWLDDGTRFHASDIRITPDFRAGFGYVRAPDGSVSHPGPPGTPGSVVAAEELGEHGFPTGGRISFAGLDLAVSPLAFAPVLLTSPERRISRFPRALCRFEAGDGRSGYGWTEWNQPQPLP
jgi:hypothetical protein